MKRHFSILVSEIAFVIIAMTALVSCENEEPTSEINNQVSASLSGTNWQNQVENGTIRDREGNPHSYTDQNFIHFTSDSEGTLEEIYDVPDLPEESFTANFPFTYTYDGSDGTITASDHGITRTLTFVIIGDKLILTLDNNYYSLTFTRY